MQQVWGLEFITSTPTISIETDFSYLALNEAGKQSFRNFRQALQAYQKELEAQAPNSYTVYPASLDAGLSK